MRRIISLTAIISLSLGLSHHSFSQTATDDKAAKQAALEAREAAEARIETQMLSMSDLTEALVQNLGQLHYLRRLCFGDDDQYWRDFAGRLLQLEAGTDTQRREALTRAFNAGYGREQERFKTCSNNVSVDAAALAENGRRLASMLGDPYRDF